MKQTKRKRLPRPKSIVGNVITPDDTPLFKPAKRYAIRSIEDIFKPLVEVTQSAVSCFLACKQKYVLAYLMRLSRLGLQVQFVIGEGFHEALEYLIVSKEEPVCRVKNTVDIIDKVFEAASTDTSSVDPKDVEKLEHGRVVTRACARAWYIVYGETLEEWEVLGTEIARRVTGTPTIPLEQMGGKVDGHVKDNNISMVLENKTTTSLRFHDASNLALDLQALWYVVMEWVVEKGIRPEGFFYNVVQKPQHRMSDKGCDDLEDRMVSAMVDDPAKYFCFTPVMLEQPVITRHMKNFDRIIGEMNALTPDAVTMNLTSCNHYNGCKFRPLCLSGADASNPESVFKLPSIDLYEVRKHVHQELDE